VPILQKREQAAGLIIEIEGGGEVFALTPEGEQFLRDLLSLKPGDEVRHKDLTLLIERGWAVREVSEPIDEPPPLVEPLAPPKAVRRSESHRPSIIRRTRAREVALQILYQCEQNAGVLPADVDRFIQRRLRDEKLQGFARAIVEGVREHQTRIDELISQAAENWRIDRMAAIDRNILRLGAFEMLYDPEVPTKVAINEALELAKRYSTAQSSRFVNGILDRLQNADPNETTQAVEPPEVAE
jgi:N utilization substance protein B